MNNRKELFWHIYNGDVVENRITGEMMKREDDVILTSYDGNDWNSRETEDIVNIHLWRLKK